MEKCELPEEELIEYAKPYLKAKNFKKKNKRWTKEEGDVTLVFYIQGSCYAKEDYYIRPGIFINALCPTGLVYGHIMTQIDITTPEQIMKDTDRFFRLWTDKKYFKQKVIDFIAWEERNPLEKRRAKLVDYEADPVPAEELFMLGKAVSRYIIDEF